MAPPRVRRHIDGSLWIPRGDRQLEKTMDAQYIRVPGALRWFPKGYNKALSEHEDKYKDSEVYILGKGPSLDRITPEVFGGSPIICVNDSIKKINKMAIKNDVFVIQQDISLREECRPSNTEHTLILSDQCKGWYADYRNRILVKPESLGIEISGPTVVLAIYIAKILGASKINFVAFDAIDGDCKYADVVGYPAEKGGDPNRFLNHKNKMIHACGNIPFEIIRLNQMKVDDIPQHKEQHLQEPDDLVIQESGAVRRDVED